MVSRYSLLASQKPLLSMPMKRLVDEKKRVHYERCSNKSIKEHVAGQWYRAFAMALSSNNEVE